MLQKLNLPRLPQIPLIKLPQINFFFFFKKIKIKMRFEKEDLDVVLIPCGLMLMFGYHLFLLYRYLRLPHTTVMGFENHDKRAWVRSVMQVW